MLVCLGMIANCLDAGAVPNDSLVLDSVKGTVDLSQLRFSRQAYKNIITNKLFF